MRNELPLQELILIHLLRKLIFALHIFFAIVAHLMSKSYIFFFLFMQHSCYLTIRI